MTNKLRLGVLISGRGSNLQALIDACAAPDYPAEIALVISNVAGVEGIERATNAGLPVLVIDHKKYPSRAEFDLEMTQAIEAAGVELICLAGFMRLLSEEFIDHWHNRMINIHPSLLPAFKGLDVQARAIAAGARFSGCTVHYVRFDMDTGPIITQAAVPIHTGDDADTLAARILVQEHIIYPQAVRWIAELIGFPKDGDGVLVSGGNVANMLGFWAARAAKAPWDIRAAGMHSAERRTLRVYASAGTHTWIQKAADLSGMGVDSIRWIEQGAEDCIDVGKLRAAIEADRASGDDPFMVVGTAGSVSTGAVDDLPALRELCDEFNLWLHADGAYGAFAAAADNVPPELKAIALADSVALDPHKWLYAPLEAGCVLVRDRDALLAAFSRSASNWVDSCRFSAIFSAVMSCASAVLNFASTQFVTAARTYYLHAVTVS